MDFDDLVAQNDFSYGTRRKVDSRLRSPKATRSRRKPDKKPVGFRGSISQRRNKHWNW